MYLFANNASTTLALGVDGVATTFNLIDGSSFPAPVDPEVFQLVIEDASGNYEVCTCTARVGNALTVVRGQEGTTGQAFMAGARVELRLTQAILEAFAQVSGFTMTGDLDLGGNAILNGTLSNPVFTGGVARGMVLRGSDNGTGNELAVPTGGGAPTIGGNQIWHAGNDGATSGLDADLLDGQQGSYYLAYANLTGVPSTFTPAAHTHVAANITDTILASQLEGKVLRHDVETSGVIRIVATAPSNDDGANGDIWLVVP